MFYDHTKIFVKAGDGGDGSIHFGVKSSFLMAAPMVEMVDEEGASMWKQMQE